MVRFIFVLAALAQAEPSLPHEQSAMLQTTRLHQDDEIPPILHRVILPRQDGGIYCSNRAEEVIKESRESWRNNNKGWFEMIWGQDAIDALLEKSQELFKSQEGLEDFVELYRGMDEWMYQQDTIRHLILYHFGGLYMDLDMDCRTDVKNFIEGHDLVVRIEGKTNFLAAKPHHPFFIKQLQRVSKTFRNGLEADMDKRPQATMLTGEHQICSTMLDDFAMFCDADHNEGAISFSEKLDGSVRFLGSASIINEPEVKDFDVDISDKCVHRIMMSWGRAAREVAKEPKSEQQLVESCGVLYDAETSKWGDALVKFVKEMKV